MKVASIYIQFVNFFNAAEEKEKDSGYDIVKLNVPMRLLHDLYNKFLLDGMDGIETVSKEKKVKYFNIASKFYEELPDRIKASKAAYVLDLITSND